MTKQTLSDEKCVSDLQHIPPFNFKAFIFSSFYYWYQGASLLFVLYAFLPIFICTLLLVLLPPLVALVTGYLISHIIAGIRANADMIKFHAEQEYYKKYADKNAPVLYYSISIKRLVFLSFISFGIYQVYWMYKNWAAVRAGTKEEIYPVFRSWFLGLLYIFQLCHRIKKSVTKFKPAGWFLSVAAIAYPLFTIVSTIGWGVLKKITVPENELTIFCIEILLLSIGTLLLIPLQKAINDNNRHLDKKQKPNTAFTLGEVIILAVSIALIVFHSFTPTVADQKSVNPVQSLSEEKQDAYFNLMNTSYQHTNGYQVVCQRYGVTLEKYPAAFQNAYREELEPLNDILASQGLSQKDIPSVLGEPTLRMMHSSLKSQLEEFRKHMILSDVAEKTGMDITQVTWQEGFNGLITMSDICTYMEDEADDIILENHELTLVMRQAAAALK